MFSKSRSWDPANAFVPPNVRSPTSCECRNVPDDSVYRSSLNAVRNSARTRNVWSASISASCACNAVRSTGADPHIGCNASLSAACDDCASTKPSNGDSGNSGCEPATGDAATTGGSVSTGAAAGECEFSGATGAPAATDCGTGDCCECRPAERGASGNNNFHCTSGSSSTELRGLQR